MKDYYELGLQNNDEWAFAVNVLRDPYYSRLSPGIELFDNKIIYFKKHHEFRLWRRFVGRVYSYRYKKKVRQDIKTKILDRIGQIDSKVLSLSEEGYLNKDMELATLYSETIEYLKNDRAVLLEVYNELNKEG